MREGGALREVHRCLGDSDHAPSLVCDSLETDASNLESEETVAGGKKSKEGKSDTAVTGYVHTL